MSVAWQRPSTPERPGAVTPGYRSWTQKLRSGTVERELDLSNCSVARTLDVVGDRWTLLVLRDAFNGVRRFDDLQRRLGAARTVLSARLAALVEAGVLDRVPYREAGQRERAEYRLT